MAQQADVGGKLAGDRVDLRALHGFVQRHLGEHAGDAPRQHRLAGPGRARHQQVVPAGRRDLDGAPRDGLPPEVRQVGAIVDPLADGLHVDERRVVGLIQGFEGLRQRSNSADLQPVDHARLRSVPWRQQQSPDAELTGSHGDRQDPAGSIDAAVERQLAQDARVRRSCPASAPVGGTASPARLRARTTNRPCGCRPVPG